MSPVEIWAAAAASIASAAVGLRAHMLRPCLGTWTQAPRPVWVALTVLAAGLGMSAASLWFGARASPREAMVYTLLAGVSVVMVWNLNRHGRKADVEREEIEQRVRAAIEASGPAARYPWERSHG